MVYVCRLELNRLEFILYVVLLESWVGSRALNPESVISRHVPAAARQANLMGDC